MHPVFGRSGATTARVFGKSVLRAAASVAATLLVPALARAIGPSDQMIPDPTNPASISATGALVNGGATGTGTVIGTSKAGGFGYISIVTANHVATVGATNLWLGSGIGGAYTLQAVGVGVATYTIPGATLPEDVAAVEDVVNLNNPGALAAFNAISTQTLTNPAGNANPLVIAGAVGTASFVKPVGITQFGYGQQGTWSAALGTAGGYTANGNVRVRLFQNNNVLTYAPAATITFGTQSYFEPINTDQALAQSAAGGGAGLPGDSGGPWDTAGGAGTVNVRGGIPINLSNSISAIFTGGQLASRNPNVVLVNSTQFAVPMDQNLYNFLSPFVNNPQLIPEPATLGLLAAATPLLALRRRRGS